MGIAGNGWKRNPEWFSCPFKIFFKVWTCRATAKSVWHSLPDRQNYYLGVCLHEGFCLNSLEADIPIECEIYRIGCQQAGSLLTVCITCWLSFQSEDSCRMIYPRKESCRLTGNEHPVPKRERDSPSPTCLSPILRCPKGKDLTGYFLAAHYFSHLSANRKIRKQNRSSVFIGWSGNTADFSR